MEMWEYENDGGGLPSAVSFKAFFKIKNCGIYPFQGEFTCMMKMHDENCSCILCQLNNRWGEKLRKYRKNEVSQHTYEIWQLVRKLIAFVS